MNTDDLRDHERPSTRVPRDRGVSGASPGGGGPGGRRAGGAGRAGSGTGADEVEDESPAFERRDIPMATAVVAPPASP